LVNQETSDGPWFEYVKEPCKKGNTIPRQEGDAKEGVGLNKLDFSCVVIFTARSLDHSIPKDLRTQIQGAWGEGKGIFDFSNLDIKTEI